MRFTPVLIVYMALLVMLTIIVKQLNKCTTELGKYKIRIQEQK